MSAVSYCFCSASPRSRTRWSTARSGPVDRKNPRWRRSRLAQDRIQSSALPTMPANWSRSETRGHDFKGGVAPSRAGFSPDSHVTARSGRRLAQGLSQGCEEMRRS